MTVDDLKKFHKANSDAELASLVGKTRGAISKWRSKGIPFATQATFEVLTNGKLKADRQALSA